MPSWKKVVISGSDASLNSLTVSNGITGSLLGTATSASYALTASYVAGASSFPFTGSAQITGSLGVTGSVYIAGSNTISSNLYNNTEAIVSYKNGAQQIRFINADNSVALNYNAIVGIRSRGTISSPTVPNVDDATLGLLGNAYDGTANGGGTAALLFLVDGAVSAGVAPQRISFLTSTTNNLNRVERLTIKSNGNIGIGKTTPSVPLDIVGTTYVTGSLGVTAAVSSTSVTSSFARISGSGNLQQTGPTLAVYGSGSGYPVFTVLGSQGELFSVSDSLTGSLFSVSDISGLPILEVFSDDTIVMGDYQAPSLYATKRYVSTVGVNNIYSIPTSSYNGAFFDYVITSASNARAGNITAIALGTAIQYNETTTMDIGNTSGVNFMVRISGNDMVLTGSFTTANWVMKTIIRSI